MKILPNFVTYPFPSSWLRIYCGGHALPSAQSRRNSSETPIITLPPPRCLQLFSSTPHHHHSFSWNVCKIFSFSGRPLPPIMYTNACHGSHIIILFCESLNPLLAAFWQVCQWSLLSLSFLDPISSSIFELTSGSPNPYYFIFPRTIANIIWQIPKSAAARVLISNASYFHRIWKKEPTHQNWKWSETVHNQSRIVNEQKLC